MASDRTLMAKALLSGPSFQGSGSLSTVLRGVGIASIIKTGTSGLIDEYTITYTDGRTQTYEVTNGAQGERGPRGDKGPRGYTGFSAYEYAVNGGYEGTEEEFTQLMASNATMAETVEYYSWTEEIKAALMACFENVAWVNPDGQTYYDALYAALYDRTWSVENVLTGCRNTNTMSAITKGRPYNAILERLPGYTMDGAVVTITMGGEDVSNYYSSGTISIPSVTGNVVITATAAALVPIAISAVYTQSGTVYDTDSLDVLKADLVVTAEYADSTSAVVTDYTLSGTLTDGTSTITVTYRNLTDTFDVTVTSPILFSLVNQAVTADTQWKSGVDLISEDVDFTICVDFSITTKTGDWKIFYQWENGSPYRGLTCGKGSTTFNVKYINTVTSGMPTAASVNSAKLVMTHTKGSGKATVYYRVNGASSTTTKTLTNEFIALTPATGGVIFGRHTAANNWVGIFNRAYIYAIPFTLAQANAFMNGDAI